MSEMNTNNHEAMYCELCGDERAPEELNEELLCPPCQEREERSSGE